MTRPDFLRVLSTLACHGVEHIVVGGVAAVLHGAPLTTFDLDLLHSRAPENCRRLEEALAQLGAYYRGHGSKRLVPRAQALSGAGHHLLMTDGGALDMLGSVGEGETFESLRHRTTLFRPSAHLSVRVLALEALIELKEQTDRPKDRAMLPLLQATLAELRLKGQ